MPKSVIPAKLVLDPDREAGIQTVGCALHTIFIITV